MNDREFDALLESAAPELPPDDVARDVTPWRRAIGNILGGSAMCSITLNFFCLNYLLPTIGVILQLLGFRPLRRENRWFRACWLLTVLRAALFLPCIALNATIYSNAVYASSVGTALTYGTVAAQLLLFFCFWRALRAVRQKAGTEVRVGSAAALLIWYAAVLALAYVQYSGLLLGLAMLGCYILILRSLFRLSREMEESGYALTPAPVRLSDEMLVRAIAALLAVAYRFSLNVAPAAEEAGFAGGMDLVIELVVNGGHLAFVVFLRAVDVEVFEADDLTLGFRHDLTDVAVEGELGESIGIQRVFAFVTFAEAVFTAAVGGGGGGIHHGDAVTQAEVQKRLGIFVVRAHHVVHVVDHGVGAGAFMENNVDVSAVEAVALDGIEKIVLVLVVEEFESTKVFVVEAVFQIVDDQDVAASLTVQCFDNVAADESGTTCDNNHMCVPPCK